MMVMLMMIMMMMMMMMMTQIRWNGFMDFSKANEDEDPDT